MRMNLLRFFGKASDDSYSIEHIPESDRYGAASSLGAIWTVANVQLGTVITGVIAVLLGLDIEWAIISVVIGNLIGCVFMAYHSAQGPKLGLPQMIQSRAQFGVYGAWLPMAAVIVLFVGFFITGAILTGESLAALLHVTLAEGIWIGSAIAFVMTYFGYEFIHRYDKFVAAIVSLIFVVITIKLVTVLPSHLPSSSPSWGVVFLMVSIAATWQLTWAPYVSDYSRYLPVNTSTIQIFWFTYLGSAVAGVWLMVVGILAGTVGGSALSVDPAGYIGTLFPGAHWLAFIGIAASLLIIQAMSLYSGFLTIMSILFASAKVPNAVNSRIVASLVIGVGGSIAAVAASGNFITNFTNFLLFLLYLIVPWTAINLTDFYIVRKGQYSIPDFFKGSGLYGKVNIRTIIIYVIALLVELPFADSSFYEGPISKHLMGGADIAWIVGLVVAAGLYLAWVAPNVRKGMKSDPVAPTSEVGSLD